MAISDVEVQSRVSAAPLSRREAVAQALAILNAPHQGQLSSTQVVRRLNAVRELVQGFKIPRKEREELDYALMRIPLNEPKTSVRAVDIIKDIFRTIEPKDDPLGPKRDSSSHIIPSDDLDIIEPNPEQVAAWETEFGMEWCE